MATQIDQTQLLPASYGGVEFKVDGFRSEFGRRGQMHEYPGRDIPYFEDMGKKADTYSFEAFVIGNNYAEQRDKLKDACLSREPGTLKHPAYGEIEAVCTSITISENSANERMATFSLEFVEVGVRSEPAEDIDFKGKIENDAKTLKEKAKQKLKKDMDEKSWMQNAKEWVTEKATQMQSALDEINTEINNISNEGQAVLRKLSIAPDNPLLNMVDVLTELSITARNIIDGPSILDLPTTFAARMEALFTVIGMQKKVKFEKETEQTGAESVPEHAGTEAVQLAFFGDCITAAIEAEMMAATDFKDTTSAEAAQAHFSNVVQRIQMSETPLSHEVKQSLNNLQASVVAYISETVKRLPEVKKIILAETKPSLVMAYDLYEDIDRRVEIIARNHIQHPGFVPAIKELEVFIR